ncbi:integrase family protein [Ruminiclostridium papyrosolvens DSM 2782]|uniref:Integrase family protein n=1 Tax=Ruminiclostridium papyrosolvens DSM 2782 TaxID=588581 RepID=F1T7W9_9FIRM|nr:tyrosine-type recombinase/integrase [Ruminiclostridium papyrosolvens]EGD49567.1 integrase family protein [Ruminiclostridium papyrosolvens DSM 2782]WES33309.1 tyrosine-type recombinase/integrase [Ruminiclostridium papyrosolvens DSM 2782]
MNWITEYENHLKTAQKSPNTISSFVSDVHEFVEWFAITYGKKFDCQVLEQDAREFRGFLLNILRRKPATINRKMAALKSFNQFLVEKGLSKDIPIAGLLLADPSDREIKTLERTEQNKLKRAIYAKGNKRDIAIYELLYNIGVRVSELVSLSLEDVHLTERNGNINYSYVIIRQGKGSKYRECPLNAQARSALDEYLKIRVSSSDNIFIGQRGPLGREAVDKILKKYCADAGIDRISSHVIRHTFCTRLIQEGVPLPTVSRLAGHSSVETTTRFYVHTPRADKIAAVEKLL